VAIERILDEGGKLRSDWAKKSTTTLSGEGKEFEGANRLQARKLADLFMTEDDEMKKTEFLSPSAEIGTVIERRSFTGEQISSPEGVGRGKNQRESEWYPDLSKKDAQKQAKLGGKYRS